MLSQHPPGDQHAQLACDSQGKYDIADTVHERTIQLAAYPVAATCPSCGTRPPGHAGTTAATEAGIGIGRMVPADCITSLELTGQHKINEALCGRGTCQ